MDLQPANNTAQITTTVSIPAILSGYLVGGQFGLTVATAAGLEYAFQASTDLTSWVSLATNTASPDGTILFVDTNAPSFEERFYRTKRLSP
jgi:hypothetical protein